MKAVWLLALVSSSVFAQPLSAFIDGAEKNNIDRRLSIEQREKTEADYRQAWAALVPSLTVSAGWTHNQYEAAATLPNGTPMPTKLVITPFDQFDGVFRIDAPLVNTSTWMRMSATSQLRQSAKERELATRDLVRLQIVQSYYGYAASLALKQAAEKSQKVATAQLALIQIRNEAGAATELEVFRAKSEVERANQVIADTKTLVATTRRTLSTLSGVDPAPEITLPAEDLRPETDVTDLEQHAAELPAVKAAASDAEAAKTLAFASRLALVPILSAQFTERLTNATGFAGQAASFNLGVNLVWRIDLATFQTWGVQDSAANTAALAIERSRLQARDQIYANAKRLESALTKIQAARAQVEFAQRAAQVARDRYSVGASTQLDVIQAERDVFSAEVNHIQARTELASTRDALHISAGLPLAE